MTRAPANLLAVRQLLLTHLNVDKDAVRSQDLEPAEVGIVGDARHIGEGDSYHLGTPEQDPRGSYSVMESTRDRALTEYACAVDVGSFRVTTPKGTFDLPHYSRWLVAQCQAGTPDTRDIREVIYSPDGKTVRRWDRLKRRSSGDNTHLWHTHKSYFRDAIKAGRDQTAVVRRYLTTIGLIEPAEILEDGMDVNLTPTAIGQVASRVWSASWGPETAGGRLLEAREESRKARLTSEAVLAAVKGDDQQAILDRINEVAAEERDRDQAAAQRDAALAELLEQYRSGSLDAKAVVDEIAARMAAGTSAPQAG